MQPQSPSPEYDFILKDKQSSGRRFPMPNLPRPVLIAASALVVLILIIVIATALTGRKNGQFASFEGVLSRGQETLRITKLASQQLNLQDPQTQALAATVNSALLSDQQQYQSYLAKNHGKVSTTQLIADTDKSSDSNLQIASQNNNLDSAYVNYIKTALTRYQTDLQTALNSSGPNGKKLLAGSIESTRALLNSAPIKS